ncbi:pyruvate, phosphate dikinase [Cellulomonas sp. zg-ZUI22]|uniref:pyruvate, phosphate dikinase n=1 Tax=Cellulomonas sp. zg-ZUI22 TaxID=2816955 RepID=UPI001A950557|nr:pyruvate, phosphate dikinase [Cellulomonas sp. zg-ZUI22]MBO0899990.1 pyruvate, phosphate dikinase [Cellulomonas sp. zg-ZUI22]
MARYVKDFSEGDKDQKDLLGGKGANLAEMTRLGLPVPPGFTITTEACRAYMRTGEVPPELRVEVTMAVRHLEDQLGRRLGDFHDPLLVSVRSGAKFSMPGMMETVLNVGLNDASVQGLAELSGDERFAWDSYRRLIQMFGRTVLDIDGDLFSEALDKAKAARGVTADVDLDADDLRTLVGTYKQIVREQSGREFPQHPREQLDMAIVAVFDSWGTERARLYRRKERIPDDLGTAVNVCSMVFGNLGPTSGTGVAFTRDPASGRTGEFGDYLVNAQGEDVVAGIRNTLSLADLEEVDPAAHAELLQAMRRLETHYRDLCDIEFTIERGKLWMLQTRVGKRTAPAAFRIACQLVDEHLITMDEALSRVTGAQLSQLQFPQFAPVDDDSDRVLLTRGMAASPGAAVGMAVFDPATAAQWAADGKDVILVRRETNPDDLGGMIAAVGVLTARGGKTSHAAVVARGMGRTCVVGAEELVIDSEARTMTARGHTVHEGDVIAIDGTSGDVVLGDVPVVPSPVQRYLEDGLDVALAEAPDDETRELVRAVDRILRHADASRRLHVHANADTAEDAARARHLGAQGIGLCRTEHMFLGERRVLVERVVLAADDTERQAALDALLPLQRQDFTDILAAMDGLPTTIRLIDPPLHEFLPDLTDLSVKVALQAERGEVDEHDVTLLAAVRRMHEANPMLGLRGVRLGLVIPGLFDLQIRAVAEAVAARLAAGGDPHAEIMVPLVGSVQELRLVRERAVAIMAEVSAEQGVTVDLPVGCMIELPRAALTADRIAAQAQFFSFGTNDLTQTTWGFSRDDVEGAFFAQYTANGVLSVSPFETLDVKGVGQLVQIAVERGRATRPDLTLGVCGEHGGDPESIRFFDAVGLDYVSCSPFRVPIARLEAGRAAIEHEGSDSR